MSTECYTKINGNYVPINSTASSGIRCMICNVFVDPDKLQEHLNTHIHPTFQVSGIRGASQMQKVNFSKLYQESTEEEIGIKSMNPEDLPKAQIIKKKAFLAVGFQDKFNKEDTIQQLHQSGQSLDPDLKSRMFTQFFDFQQQQPLQYSKKVNFNNQKVRVQEKGIHLYQSQSALIQKKDEGGNQQKILHVPQRISTVYELKKIADQQKQTQIQSKPKGHRYSIATSKKNPRATLNISTATKIKKQQQTPRKVVKDDRSDWTELNSDKKKSPKLNRRFECPQCHGFYCDYCKSDIPPIYRPVPDEEGKYHLHPNQKTIDFYRNHYYPRINLCNNCQQKKI